MTPAPHVKGKLSESTRQEMVKAMVKHLVALHSEGAAGGEQGAASGRPNPGQAPGGAPTQPPPAIPGQGAEQQPVQAEQPVSSAPGAAPGAPQMPQVIHVVHHIAPPSHGGKAAAPAHKAPERK